MHINTFVDKKTSSAQNTFGTLQYNLKDMVEFWFQLQRPVSSRLLLQKNELENQANKK